MSTKESTEPLKKLYKMNFIYNAVQDGWKVKQLKKNAYEFRKGKKGDEPIKDFLKKQEIWNDELRK